MGVLMIYPQSQVPPARGHNISPQHQILQKFGHWLVCYTGCACSQFSPFPQTHAFVSSVPYFTSEFSPVLLGPWRRTRASARTLDKILQGKSFQLAVCPSDRQERQDVPSKHYRQLHLHLLPGVILDSDLLVPLKRYSFTGLVVGNRSKY